MESKNKICRQAFELLPQLLTQVAVCDDRLEEIKNIPVNSDLLQQRILALKAPISRLKKLFNQFEYLHYQLKFDTEKYRHLQKISYLLSQTQNQKSNLAISPDNNLIATANPNEVLNKQTIVVIDRSNIFIGRVQHSDNKKIRKLRFSPDHKRLFYLGEDPGELYICPAVGNHITRGFSAENNSIFDYHPATNLILSINKNTNSLNVINYEAVDLNYQLKIPPGRKVVDAVFHPAKPVFSFISINRSKQMQLISINYRLKQQLFKKELDYMFYTGLRYLMDGRFLSLTDSTNFFIYQSDNLKLINQFRPVQQPDSIDNCVAFAHRYPIVAYWQKISQAVNYYGIRLYDYLKNITLNEFYLGQNPHINPLAFSADDQNLYAINRDKINIYGFINQK